MTLGDVNVPLNEFLIWKRLLESVPEPQAELKKMIIEKMSDLMHTCNAIMEQCEKDEKKK